MMKQWLMRRAVRMPVSRATTAPISSSVCRLPFISASARPARPARPPWRRSRGCALASTIVEARRCRAQPAPRRRGCAPRARPGSGSISPSRAASTALSSETASQGWATAVVDRRHAAAPPSTRRSYLSCAPCAAGTGIVRHWPSSFGRLRSRLAAEQRLRSAPAGGWPSCGQLAAARRQLRRSAASAGAALRARLRQQPGNGAHGALLVEPQQQELVA